ncbi:hypothetical protein [Streptomyces sp. NPDC058086]|uniref:hypothetical protein n=1 Tax=Streptomyces sp. NPDC058086 TaxID=3346334 RepID=UPI0036E618D8
MTVRNLEAALPGLSRKRRPAALSLDWVTLESELEFRFPTDFKELAEFYPEFSLCDFLSVLAPRPTMEQEFIEEARDLLTVLQDNHDCGVAEFLPHPNEGGLFPWGMSTSGDVYYWKVHRGQDSGIITGSRADIFWEFEGSFTDFLAGWLDGSLLPDDQPTAEQLGGPHFRLTSTRQQ